MCSERRIPSKNNNKLIGLTDRLRLLIKQESLSPIAKGAAGLRNVAAHADIGELEPEEVQYLEALEHFLSCCIPEVGGAVEEIGFSH